MAVRANPNVVPLCDILLVLLIIFMVISPLAQEGMDIKIPETGTSGEGRFIVLSIESDGTLNLNNEPFSDYHSLESRLRDVFSSRTDKTIFVQAHKEVAYQEVIKGMDAAKRADVSTIVLIPYTKR